MHDGAPALKVYFDSGKTAVAAGFAETAKTLVEHLKANATSKAVVSGFNDPTGNAAANAELSKNRAKGVAAALKAAGIADDRVLLEKPADTTGSALSNSEARRVEVTIRK
jgi:outer membrane protein OmpA-like peptidoglycan-associated protein